MRSKIVMQFLQTATLTLIALPVLVKRLHQHLHARNMPQVRGMLACYEERPCQHS